MKKPILIIGTVGTGKTTKVKAFIDEIIELPKTQIIVLEEVGNSLLEGQSLPVLIQTIFGILPDAQIVMTLQSAMQLSPSELAYAKENFEVFEAVSHGTFVKHEESEILIEGISVRLHVHQKDAPDFFNLQNDRAIRNASFVLNVLYGEDAKLTQLHQLLVNENEYGENVVSEALGVRGLDRETRNKLFEISSWFFDDYFSKESTSTYRHSSGARSYLKQLAHSTNNHVTS